jgi:hypothetical protein
MDEPNRQKMKNFFRDGWPGEGQVSRRITRMPAIEALMVKGKIAFRLRAAAGGPHRLNLDHRSSPAA